MGIEDRHIQSFNGFSSTYAPFILAFGVATFGTLAALFIPGKGSQLLAILLNSLGGWAMFAELDFQPHWAKLLIRPKKTGNVLADIQPALLVKRHLVLCAHLDTHRTPIFYSSPTWHKLFSFLVLLALISMVLGGLVFFLQNALDWAFLRWITAGIFPFQLFSLALVVSADFTPHSPGANDNASGVGVIMGLAARLREEPLQTTAVRLLFTDCEETGSWGMRYYLEGYPQQPGEEWVFIVLDEVGLENIIYLRADGLIRKHKTHPFALNLAREASARSPSIPITERLGLAYTDALPVTIRGIPAVTVCSVPRDPSTAVSHWHQVSDRIEFVSSQALDNSHRFVWEIMQDFDAG